MGTTQPKGFPVEIDSNDYRLGHHLHSTISPARWCITKEDLAFFKQEVRRAWMAGEIPNAAPGSDYWNEYHDDPTVGPTMYAVNEHVIKPLTARYGGMSFALLLNPDGLQCDLFVTHAWAEGVFEFLEKVQRSWPSHCKHAYICFLSNPQNLDISDMLNVPVEKSPFAQALCSAQTMLVVPTRFTSIYNRLWCCYEAYLAYTLGKHITLPTTRYMVAWVKLRLLLQLAAFSLGVILTWFLSDSHTYQAAMIYFLTFCSPILVLLIVACPIMFLNVYVGVGLQLLTGFFAGAFFFVAIEVVLRILRTDYGNDMYALESFLLDCMVVTGELAHGTFLALLGLSGTLRARVLEASKTEAGELYFKDGSLAHASCSSSVDRKRILKAISGKEVDVEHALRVLLRQGISTAEMQRASLAWSNGHEGYLDYGKALLVGNLYMLVAINDFLFRPYIYAFKWDRMLVLQGILRVLIWVGPFTSILVACISSAAAELTTLIVNTCLVCILPLVATLFVWHVFKYLQVGWDPLYDSLWEVLSITSPYNVIISAMLLVWRRHQHIRRKHLYSFCRHALLASSCLGWTLKACAAVASGRRCFIFFVIAVLNFLTLTCTNVLLTSRLAAVVSAFAAFAQFAAQLAITWIEYIRFDAYRLVLALQCSYLLALAAFVVQSAFRFNWCTTPRVDMNLESGADVLNQHIQEEVEMAIVRPTLACIQ